MNSISSPPSVQNLPIGVFDSGVGGLTVLRELQAALPQESFIYLGDTARLPYGSKGADTVQRYAVQAARVLGKRGIKLLVIACNTASAVALDAVQVALPGIPVIGVIEAGVEAACQATPEGGGVLVTATRGTIYGGAYQKAIVAKKPSLRVIGVACPLFVALAEEGWGSSDIAQAVARRYLKAHLQRPEGGDEGDRQVSTIVLGCTHFPMLAASIAKVAAEISGTKLTLVDSAKTTAQQVLQIVQQRGLGRQEPAFHEGPRLSLGEVHFLATDSIESFAAAGASFLGHDIDPCNVEWVDL